MTIDVRLLKDHTASRADYHDWVFIGDTERRDSIGRKANPAYHIWLVVICNNTECEGRALVRSGYVEDAVEAQYPCPAGRKTRDAIPPSETQERAE